MREGGDDVEWVGKALTAVETERVWNGERGSVGAENGVGGGVGGGVAVSPTFEACYFFLTGRQTHWKPFHTSETLAGWWGRWGGWRGGGEGGGGGHWKPFHTSKTLAG